MDGLSVMGSASCLGEALLVEALNQKKKELAMATVCVKAASHKSVSASRPTASQPSTPSPDKKDLPPSSDPIHTLGGLRVSAAFQLL